MKILKVNPVVENIKNIEEPSAMIGYGYDKDTEVWRIITLKYFDDEMEKLLRVFSTCWSGIKDPSELPSAYKNASSVITDIKKYNFATIMDKVLPYGSIMYGKN